MAVNEPLSPVEGSGRCGLTISGESQPEIPSSPVHNDIDQSAIPDAESIVGNDDHSAPTAYLDGKVKSDSIPIPHRKQSTKTEYSPAKYMIPPFVDWDSEPEQTDVFSDSEERNTGTREVLEERDEQRLETTQYSSAQTRWQECDDSA